MTDELDALIDQTADDLASALRHYGPGPHPGTGTDQTVHGGEGGREKTARPLSHGELNSLLADAAKRSKTSDLYLKHRLLPVQVVSPKELPEKRSWSIFIAPDGTMYGSEGSMSHNRIARFALGKDVGDTTGDEEMILSGAVRVLWGSAIGPHNAGMIGIQALETPTRAQMRTINETFELYPEADYGTFWSEWTPDPLDRASGKDRRSFAEHFSVPLETRHYGPGPHPGTGTEQEVHAGDGGGEKRDFPSIAPNLLPLARLSQKYDSFEEFKADYTIKNFTGLAFHLTGDADFEIDPAKGPRDASTMGAGGGITPGQLMVTTDIENWAETLGSKRKYAALIDYSELTPGEDFRNVSRGFGHEINIFHPEKAQVVEVYPLDKARKFSDYLYSRVLPQSEEALREIYDWAREPERVLRHYGPGPHPGTGTEQTVHAGGDGRAKAMPSRTREWLEEKMGKAGVDEDDPPALEALAARRLRPGDPLEEEVWIAPSGRAFDVAGGGHEVIAEELLRALWFEKVAARSGVSVTLDDKPEDFRERLVLNPPRIEPLDWKPALQEKRREQGGAEAEVNGAKITTHLNPSTGWTIGIEGRLDPAAENVYYFIDRYHYDLFDESLSFDSMEEAERFASVLVSEVFPSAKFTVGDGNREVVFHGYQLPDTLWELSGFKLPMIPGGYIWGTLDVAASTVPWKTTFSTDNVPAAERRLLEQFSGGVVTSAPSFSASEAMLQAYGFLRVSRGGLGGGSDIGATWNSEVGLTDQQIRKLAAVGRDSIESRGGVVAWNAYIGNLPTIGEYSGVVQEWPDRNFAAAMQGQWDLVARGVIPLELRSLLPRRHYGPGPHPGTGTEQVVHAGGGGGQEKKVDRFASLKAEIEAAGGVAITSGTPADLRRLAEFRLAYRKRMGVGGWEQGPGDPRFEAYWVKPARNEFGAMYEAGGEPDEEITETYLRTYLDLLKRNVFAYAYAGEPMPLLPPALIVTPHISKQEMEDARERHPRKNRFLYPTDYQAKWHDHYWAIEFTEPGSPWREETHEQQRERLREMLTARPHPIDLGVGAFVADDLFPNQVEGTFLHEWGHALHRADAFPGADQRAGRLIYPGGSGAEHAAYVEKTRRALSFYAGENDTELIAEAYCVSQHPDYPEKAPPDMRAVVEFVLHGGDPPEWVR